MNSLFYSQDALNQVCFFALLLSKFSEALLAKGATTVNSPKSLHPTITSLNLLETFSHLRAGPEFLGSGREISCIPVHYQIDL